MSELPRRSGARPESGDEGAATEDATTEALPTVGGVTGPARIGTVRDLTARAKPGDVLVIDALDLREADAYALALTGAVAVVNAQSTASGRQPAAGARTLLDAGLTVIDGAGSAVLAVRDGVRLTLSGDRVMRGAAVIAEGTALTTERVVEADTAALDHLKVQVAVFGSHALERLEREGALFFEGRGLPELGIDVKGRVVLVVMGSDAAAADLKSLRLFIADRRPIIIAEGGAVDACLAERLRPSVIVGDVDRAPEAVLATARTIALAGDRESLTRLDAMNANYELTDVALAGSDLATLAAHHAGAEVVVVAGRRDSAVDVLSAEPDVGIGSFLTSLVVRRGTVDAEVIAGTYRHRHSLAFVWTVLILAVATLAIALWSVDDVRSLVDSTWDTLSGWFGGSS
jgi:uncharacterized membrane-anchored protein